MKKVLLISLTFFLALSLSILPMPDSALWLRPTWIALTLIFWVMLFPDQISVGVAWMLGIMMDLLNGTLLGEYALALAVIAFLTSKLYRQLRVFPWWRQMAWVCFFILIYQLILFTIQAVSGQLIVNWFFWLVPIISMMLWPLLRILLQYYQQKFRLT